MNSASRTFWKMFGKLVEMSGWSILILSIAVIPLCAILWLLKALGVPVQFLGWLGWKLRRVVGLLFFGLLAIVVVVGIFKMIFEGRDTHKKSEDFWYEGEKPPSRDGRFL